MSNILKNNNVKIVSEFCPGGLKRFGIDSEEYLKLLIKFGFKLYEVSEREKKIKSVDIPKLLKIYTPRRNNFTNLLCVKENDLSIPLVDSSSFRFPS